jgi:hypothetical protein
MIKTFIISLLITLLIVGLVVYLILYLSKSNNKTITIKADDEKEVSFTTEKIESLTKAFFNICEYETEVTIMVDSYILEVDKDTNEITLIKDVLYEEKKRLKEEKRNTEIEEVFQNQNERKVTEPSILSDADVTIPKHLEGIEISPEIESEQLVDEVVLTKKESFSEKIMQLKKEANQIKEKHTNKVEQEVEEVKDESEPKSISSEEIEENLMTSKEPLPELSEDDTLYNFDKKLDIESYNEFNL